ncbi:MAG: molecular chaperone DnaK [Planctomycetota bacterium]
MGIAIGVDLGTTNSVVSAYIDGRVVPLENASGTRTIPSVITFPQSGGHLVGHAAKAQQVTSPDRSIYSIKRFMGRRHSEVSHEEKLVPYSVVGKPSELVKVRMGRRLHTPQEISAIILEELKDIAEAAVGQPVTESVITVPAYFNDAQRQATREAAEIAGMNARRIINEPTAAALAYGLENARSKRAVVIDFGGGTLDLSAMDIHEGRFEVLAVHGNTHLGGDDFDQRIIDVVADDFLRRERIDLREDAMALQRLKEAAQIAKTELSSREQTEIILPYVGLNKYGPVHLQYTLTRETFEGICADLFDSLRTCCEELREYGGIGMGPNMEVILVGGSTRMPAVREIVAKAFRTDKLNKSVNPDEVVGVGAGILASVLAGQMKNVHLMDVTSQSLGVESAGGGVSTIVPRNTPLPHSTSRVYSTPSDNQTSVPINMLEGDDAVAQHNRTLGLFRLKGIRRAKRGVPQIKVTFDIDADGILSVKASDVDTGKSQEVVIQGGSGLAPDHRDRLVAEGEHRRTARQQRREQIDLCDHAEGVVINLSKWLTHNKSYIGGSKANQISNQLGKLSKAIESRREDKIRRLLAELDGIMPRKQAG